MVLYSYLYIYTSPLSPSFSLSLSLSLSPSPSLSLPLLLFPSQSCHVFSSPLWRDTPTNDSARHYEGDRWVGGPDGGSRLVSRVGAGVWEQGENDGMFQSTSTLPGREKFHITKKLIFYFLRYGHVSFFQMKGGSLWVVICRCNYIHCSCC